MPKLENWELKIANLPFVPKYLQPGILVGTVYDHEHLTNGEKIVTSMVVKINLESGTAETISGSKYVLGKPDPEWIAWIEQQENPEFKKLLETITKLRSHFIN